MNAKLQKLAGQLRKAASWLRGVDEAACYVYVDLKDGYEPRTAGIYGTATLGDVFRRLVEDAKAQHHPGCSNCSAVLTALEAASAAFEVSLATNPDRQDGRQHLH